MAAEVSTIMALDLGDRRIGVAVANTIARIARPLGTLERTPDAIEEICRLAKEQGAGVLVIGMPRNLQGNPTSQTEATEAFAVQLESAYGSAVHRQDEALTSVAAERELKAVKGGYGKGDIDALAAAYILEDYLMDHQEDWA